MTIFDFIDEELSSLKEDGLFRTLKTIEKVNGISYKVKGKEVINFCSNNYLGLSFSPAIIRSAEVALKEFGAGSGASRLVSGNYSLHEQLESAIAMYHKTPAAIIFPTGYMTNLGTIQGLVGAGDAVIIDRLDHASIVDGARLSGAKLLVYAHKDMKALEKVLKKAKAYKKRLIISDHVFSMDGDVAPVDEMTFLAKKYDAMLMLDVAHTIEPFVSKDPNVIIMGTLSKTIGSLGGYIAGSSKLIDYLRNKVRAYIFTTALPASIVASAMAAFEILMNDKYLVKGLKDNVEYARNAINKLGFDTMGSTTQIIPISIGDASKALKISEFLFDKGILLSAIRPPTVPNGTSRLRLSITALHTKEDIDKLVSALKLAKEKFLG
jgi:8-amino-7-oxononanoate synthase